MSLKRLPFLIQLILYDLPPKWMRVSSATLRAFKTQRQCEYRATLSTIPASRSYRVFTDLVFSEIAGFPRQARFTVRVRTPFIK